MKRKLMLICALLFALGCTACDSSPQTNNSEDEQETVYATLSPEEISRLREKITRKVSGENNVTVTTYATSEIPEEGGFRCFMTGIWTARTTDGTERYFIFSDGKNGHYLEQETGMGMGFTYGMADDETAIFHFGDAESNDLASISWVSTSNAYVKWADGTMETFKLINGNPEAELNFYSNQELSEMAMNYYQQKNQKQCRRSRQASVFLLLR